MSTIAGGLSSGSHRLELAAWLVLLVVAVAVASLIGWMPAAALLGFAVLQRARPLDPLDGFLLVVGAASFADYLGGRLTFQLSVLSLLILFALYCHLIVYRSEAFVLPRGPLATTVLLYLGLSGLNFVRGIAIGNSRRFAGLELFAALALGLSLLVSRIRIDRRRMFALLVGLYVIGLAHVALGLLTFAAAHERRGGVYFTPVPGLITVLLFNFALHLRRDRNRWLVMLALLPFIAHQFLSFTRGFWIGLMAGVAWSVAVYGGWGPGSRERWTRAGRLLGALVLAAALAITLLSVAFDIRGLAAAAWRRLSSSAGTQFSGETASNFVRLLEYDEALRAWRASPWIGRGLGYSFITQDPFFRTRIDQWYVHHSYLLVALKQGVIGLALFVAMLVAAVATGLRGRRLTSPWVAAWCAGTAAATFDIMVISNMHYPFGEVNSTFTIALMWGGMLALVTRSRWRFHGQGSDRPA